jgi:hypothetical protein
MKRIAWIALTLAVLFAPTGFSMLQRASAADTPACCTNHEACCPSGACCKGGSHSAGMHCRMGA